MTNGEELRSIRHGLGITMNEFADRLGIKGKHRRNTIWRYEVEAQPVSGPVLLLARRLRRSK